ncbi:MAG TPA: NADH-quinone oxidoreductase subunit M [Bacillota bacterium]
MSLPILTLIVFVPLAGSLLITLVPRNQEKTIKQIALVATIISAALVAYLWTQFKYGQPGMQFGERATWIPSLGIQYLMGVDGISLSLLILTGLLSVLACLASWNITHRAKEYFVLFLLLVTGMFGVFVALDYVLFYVFWELVLVPMFFLIGIWGGPRREYAAMKFFIYTLAGSVLMLVGILAIYFQAGLGTFDMVTLAQHKYPVTWQWWIFLLLYAGFAVKVPVFPFHTWLPDAHVEAPTAISVLLAGVLLKMGTYGFFRIALPTLPDAARAWAPIFAVLGVINIVYGALVAMAQTDLKKMVAYSSINHMGYVMLGLAAAMAAGPGNAAAAQMAITGAAYQMFAHGLSSGMLFLMVGVVYDRTHTRDMGKLSGLYLTFPVWATFMAFGAFASLGLPGLSGFVAEFFVLLGAFPIFKVLVVLATLGMVFTAAFYLLMMRKVLMGQKRPEYDKMPDANPRELITLVPLTILIVVFGVAPAILINLINPALVQLVARLGGM